MTHIIRVLGRIIKPTPKRIVFTLWLLASYVILSVDADFIVRFVKSIVLIVALYFLLVTVDLIEGYFNARDRI